MEVGKISAYSLEKNFSSFYYEISGRRWDYVTRVLHNQEQVIRCQLRDGNAAPKAYIKYWNMDGTPAAQFTVGSGGVPYTNILDMSWITDEQKLCYITVYSGGAGLGSTGYSVVRALPDGASPELLIKNINTTYTVPIWSQASVSGYVGITTSTSGLYIKIGPELHVVDSSAFDSSLGWEWGALVSGGYVKSSTNSFHYGNGSACYNLMFQEQNNSGYVMYTWYDSNISTLYLRSISVSGTAPAYLPRRWTMLDVSDYSSIQYPFFLNQLDTSSLHYEAVTTSTGISGYTVTVTPAYLKVFNIDDDLAAFLNVNSSDSVMPAGIGATADIIARVANCWGTTLSGKLVQFWVSSGDGGVYPTYDYTDIDGRAITTFTTGANVGISNVAVVVNEV